MTCNLHAESAVGEIAISAGSNGGPGNGTGVLHVERRLFIGGLPAKATEKVCMHPKNVVDIHTRLCVCLLQLECISEPETIAQNVLDRFAPFPSLSVSDIYVARTVAGASPFTHACMFELEWVRLWCFCDYA